MDFLRLPALLYPAINYEWNKGWRSTTLKVKGEINEGMWKGSISEPLIFDIFSNDLFYIVKQGNMYNYTDGNSISISY